MDLVESYDTLYQEVSERTGGIENSQKSAATQWRRGGDVGLSELDRQKVRANDPELAERLDRYAELVDEFGELGRALDKGLKESTRTSVSEELVIDLAERTLSDRLYTPTNTANTLLGDFEIGDDGIVGDNIYASRWVFENVEPILEASDPEAFRERLKAEAYDISGGNQDVGDLYDKWEQEEAEDPELDPWYEQLWDFVHDPDGVSDGQGKRSIRSILVERSYLNQEIAEEAQYLEQELDYNRQEQLDDYSPSLAERLERNIRRAFS